MGRLTTPLLFLAILLFLGSLAIHVATYFDLYLPDRWPILWGVYILVFVMSIFVVVDGKERTGAPGKVPLFTAFEPGSKSLAEFVAAILIFYAVLVLMIWFVSPNQGNPDRIDGRAVISSHGRIVRELTEKEYSHARAVEMRGLSALVLLFSGVDALEVLSLFLLEKKRRSMDSAAASRVV